MPSQKLSQQQCLAVAQSMFNNRPRGNAAPMRKDPFAGKVVKVGVLGRLDSWIEKKGFGFIKTPDMDTGLGRIARVFCHNRGFLKDCHVNNFVKFDVWQDKHTRRLEAINVAPSQITFIEVAKDQFGTMEQWYELIRGADGKTFRCGKDDFDDQSSFRRFDRVRFDSIWQGGQFRAVNIRSEWSQEEWDRWNVECRARWCVEAKVAAVDDSVCASTDAGTEAAPEPVNPEVRKLLKKLREIDALVGRVDLDANQQAKIEKREGFQKRLERVMV